MAHGPGAAYVTKNKQMNNANASFLIGLGFHYDNSTKIWSHKIYKFTVTDEETWKTNPIEFRDEISKKINTKDDGKI